MNNLDKVAVCSRSFSQNDSLRSMLLEKYEHVKFNEKGQLLSGDSLIDFLAGYSGAIIGLEYIDDKVLSQLPKLKFVGKYGVGLDKIDLNAMDKHGVKLGWSPGVNSQNVAEFTVTMILNLLKNFSQSVQLASDGGWHQIKGYQLSSMTVGVLGCGHVGKALVKILKSFGCGILVCDIEDVTDFCEKNDALQVSLSTLIAKSNILSVHVPKNATTNNILNEDVLLKMKKGSYVINSARGGLIDEAAVMKLLDADHLAGAAFDVLEEEPPLDLRLIKHPKTIVTTHIAGSSYEAINAMGIAAIDGLIYGKKASSFSKFK